MISRRLRRVKKFLPLRHVRLTPGFTYDLGALADVPAGYHPTNPSIVGHGDGYLVCVRCVNYTIDDKMRYTFHVGDNYHTVNKVFRLHRDLSFDRRLDRLSESLGGLEDVRFFPYGEEIMGIASTQGGTAMVLIRIADDLTGADMHELASPTHRAREKNWSPFVDNDKLKFIYSFDPLVVLDAYGAPTETCSKRRLEFFVSGSTPGLPNRGRYLFIDHRRKEMLLSRRLVYVSRVYEFVPVSNRMAPRGSWFTIGHPTVQFISGLAVYGDQLLISYGDRDRSALLAVFNLAELPAALRRLRSAS